MMVDGHQATPFAQGAANSIHADISESRNILYIRTNFTFNKLKKIQIKRYNYKLFCFRYCERVMYIGNKETQILIRCSRKSNKVSEYPFQYASNHTITTLGKLRHINNKSILKKIYKHVCKFHVTVGEAHPLHITDHSLSPSQRKLFSS